MLMTCARARPQADLQMHVVVERPCGAVLGRISCRPIGMEPIVFRWSPPSDVELEIDSSGSEAGGVRPGRYRIVATDAVQSKAEVVVDVEPIEAVVVSEYRVTPASTSRARDGAIEAVGMGLEGWRYLWTNGVETTTPTLRDVPAGTYAVVVVTDGPMVINACPPARVDVKKK